ncbi:MAG: replication-relaxation family protein [Candidatus Solibacter sp.]
MTPGPKKFPQSGPKLSRGNPTKQRVLELLAEFFCLRTNDVAGLLRNRSITESDARSVRRTLSILHRDGFLYRVPHFDFGHERGGVAYVYGLSAKGVAHALRNGYSTPATKTLDEHSLRTLDHELEITSFHIALHRLCARHGLRYAWQQTDLKHTVHPDAVFNVADPAHLGKAFCYFLEIERSKLGNYRNGEPQILRKLRAFYDYFNSTGCEKEWGFRQYRVVVVQRTDARREGLLTALREKCSHRMFWLTTEAAYREDIGGAIFMTPKDDAPVPFSFLTQ